jgi:hypothetical protein
VFNRISISSFWRSSFRLPEGGFPFLFAPLPETGLFILCSSFDGLRMTGDVLRMTDMGSTLSKSKGRTMSTVYQARLSRAFHSAF